MCICAFNFFDWLPGPSENECAGDGTQGDGGIKNPVGIETWGQPVVADAMPIRRSVSRMKEPRDGIYEELYEEHNWNHFIILPFHSYDRTVAVILIFFSFHSLPGNRGYRSTCPFAHSFLEFQRETAFPSTSAHTVNGQDCAVRRPDSWLRGSTAHVVPGEQARKPYYRPLLGNP